jgi:glycogen debranching enzyme
MVSWIEDECSNLRQTGELALQLPPNFFPYIRPEDRDWRERYALLNRPGDYHNGGVWPFICGFYVAALVAARKYRLAEEKLLELTRIVRLSVAGNLNFGFNEWLNANDGMPKGQEWQTWSAALYLYAAKCVEEKRTPFFDEIREERSKPGSSPQAV